MEHCGQSGIAGAADAGAALAMVKKAAAARMMDVKRILKVWWVYWVGNERKIVEGVIFRKGKAFVDGNEKIFYTIAKQSSSGSQLFW